MSPENMDSRDEDRYDRFKLPNLRQRLGAFITRNLIQGDVDVAGSIHDGELKEQLQGALAEGLEAEYDEAIGRAQSLLVAVSEAHLPGFLGSDEALRHLESDELQEAIQRWAVLAAKPLQRLRSDTDACAYLRDDISENSQLEYCARVSRAEKSLRDTLYAELLDSAEE